MRIARVFYYQACRANSKVTKFSFIENESTGSCAGYFNCGMRVGCGGYPLRTM